jgi:hypothetical protein
VVVRGRFNPRTKHLHLQAVLELNHHLKQAKDFVDLT